MTDADSVAQERALDRDAAAMSFDDRDARIYLAGHTGLVGSAIHRRLEREGYRNVLTRSSRELDLRDQSAVGDFFQRERPAFVILAAAKVGGILANDTYPAEFLYDNLMIAANVIHASHRAGVRKLLNLGSSCIYPKRAPQPLAEDALLTGPLEPTNRPYAIAKIAAIELCDTYRRQYGADFVSAMPTNLYGPHDNFDLRTSHAMAALIRKFADARERGDRTVEVWGTGTPKREFLYVDDLAEACLFLMRHASVPGPINVGVGEDISIADLARLIADVAGFEGEIAFDTSKPDGTPRKLMDVRRIHAMGWKARTGLRAGIEKTLAWYREHAKVA